MNVPNSDAYDDGEYNIQQIVDALYTELHPHEAKHSGLLLQTGNGNNPEHPIFTCSYTPAGSTGLSFRLKLYEDEFDLDIDDHGSFVGGYEEEFVSEKVAAKQLLRAVTMLLNGQLAVFTTYRHDQPYATELVLHSNKTKKPITLETRSKYAPKQDKNKQHYSIREHSNSLDIAPIGLPDDFFMAMYNDDSSLQQDGRTPKFPLTPLLPEDIEFLAEQPYRRAMGQQSHETEWMFYYRSWEFWTVATVAIGTYTSAVWLNLIPEAGGYGHFLAPIVWAIIFRAIIDPLLRRKEDLKSTAPTHPWLRFDRWIHGYLSSIAFSAYGLASASLLFMPLFSLSNGRAANIIDIAVDQPWVWSVPTLIVTGLLASWTTRDRALYTPGILVSIAVVLIALVDARYSTSGSETAEPFNSIIVFSIIGSAVLLFTFLFYTYKARFEYPVDGKKRDIWESVDTLLRRLVVAANLGGAIALGFGASRMADHLKPDMLNGISVQTYTISSAISAAILLLASLVVLIRRTGHSMLYWIQVSVVLLIFGLFGMMTTDKINDLESTTWLLLFAGLFVPLIVGSFYNFSREYMQAKILAARNN